MKLFVRRIPYKFSDEDLKNIFETVGPVASANIIKDKFTQRSRGFGFVEMESSELGQEAIEKLNGYTVDGMALTVEVAQDKKDRPSRPGGPGGASRGGFGQRRERSGNYDQ